MLNPKIHGRHAKNIIIPLIIDAFVLLSGGINPYSVKAIREFHHPKLAGIDINSRFETAPGNKDVERIGKFLQAIRTGETAG